MTRTTPRKTTFTVGTADLRAALAALKPHICPHPELPHLYRVGARLGGDGNLYLSATNRYTAGVAVVSVWEDDADTGEIIEFALSPDDVASILFEFKATKAGADEPSDRVQVVLTAADLTLRDASGLFPDAAKSLTVPRIANDDEFPDILTVVAEAAWHGGGYGVDRFAADGKMVAGFKAASDAYSEPLVLEPTSTRTSILVRCGESFLGLLMPVRLDDGQTADHARWRDAWTARLPAVDGTRWFDPTGGGLRSDRDADPDDEGGDGEGGVPDEQQTTLDMEPDPALMSAASDLVVTAQYASTAMVQRKLRVTFAEAGAILARLEAHGIVGPADDTGNRPVLVTN